MISWTNGHVKRALMVNVTRYILDGYEKMEVEVYSETNMVKEIKIGSPKRPSKKRKKESSNSEHTTTKQKITFRK